MSAIVYDTGALIAAERNRRTFVAQHETLLAARVRPLVPAGVLAQAWNARPSSAVLHRVLRGCEVLPLTESRAKAAAELCHRAGSNDAVDASVVLTAIEYLDAPILTDDLGDLGKLVDASGHTRIRVARP
ncbi:PIN domain-containing protein [Kitasatospora sp. GAS204B]|uniref:PIN domain-containing protein n=1 Tax=unclassified Kitasatospora TaxID=2633591 RepID=UPI002474643A|nr:PIN domain-containing protein [Kitasatospora sp. GAS204B]MDH6118033.1 putative nucleic acid-binding protein [Kitasatospora sp. GAS204B]